MLAFFMQFIYKSLILFVSILSMTGCGSFVANSDKPRGFYLAGADAVSGNFGIKVAENAPANGGEKVTGISCKNKLWEAKPTNEKAVAVLKREVRDAGYNTVYIVSVEKDSTAILKNCWSAIKALGIAFNS